MCAPSRLPETKSGRLAASQSARSQTCWLRRCARGSLGKSSSSSSLKTLAQLGSRKMKGRPASICGAMRSRTLREIGAGGAEQAEVVERTAAADVPFGNFNLEAGLREDSFGGCECLRMVVVVPGVGPEQDRRGAILACDFPGLRIETWGTQSTALCGRAFG